MRSLIFIYEAFAEWEAVPLSFLLSGLGKVYTFGFERVKGKFSRNSP